MEIERINENTVKFYISYLDIEDRGFEREEIWYNRERSEQLFWEVMEEVNFKEDFTIEGPLWIQVQALDKGLEIIVTKAQISKNGENIELPIEDDTTLDIPVEKSIEQMFHHPEELTSDTDGFTLNENDTEEKNLESSIIVRFNEFEDVIQLSHYLLETDLDADDLASLYHYKDKYYLYVEFNSENETDINRDDLISKIYEFATPTNVTIHLLDEYGKKIFEENVFEKIREIFPA